MKLKSLLKAHRNMYRVLFEEKWQGIIFVIVVITLIINNFFSYKRSIAIGISLSVLILFIYLSTMYVYDKEYKKYNKEKEN